MKNKSSKQPNHQGALAAALLAIIGAAVGVTVAYQNADIRNEVNIRAKRLGKQFNKSRATVQKNVQAIFGKVSLELEKNYLEVQSHVMASIDQLATLAKDNQKNIDKAIEDVVKNYAKAEKWTKQAADNFSKMLKAEWSKQTKAATKAKPTAKAPVKPKAAASAKKPVKAVAKKSPAKKAAPKKSPAKKAGKK